MRAENQEELDCPQRDSAEHEGYAGVRSIDIREDEERGGADLLERILSRGNLNRAYKRVRANKGAPGIDGMTVEEALPWLREHREELLESIRNGKYKPQPVRRKEIPKPDGGVRKLGIPTVVDRIIQQAIAQRLVPIYEPLFSEDSYGYRPNKSAQQAIQKVKRYAEQGYTQAVQVDLSKYFDTLNHELLMNLLRKNVHDKRVIERIKRYLKVNTPHSRNIWGALPGLSTTDSGTGRRTVGRRARALPPKPQRPTLRQNRRANNAPFNERGDFSGPPKGGPS